MLLLSNLTSRSIYLSEFAIEAIDSDIRQFAGWRALRLLRSVLPRGCVAAAVASGGSVGAPPRSRLGPAAVPLAGA